MVTVCTTLDKSWPAALHQPGGAFKVTLGEAHFLHNYAFSQNPCRSWFRNHLAVAGNIQLELLLGSSRAWGLA